jgi:hypothetical protein
MASNYLREVDQDYQQVLDGNSVLITTAESNYSLVWQKTYDTPEEAIKAYWNIKFGMATGKGLWAILGINSAELPSRVRDWEALRMARAEARIS